MKAANFDTLSEDEVRKFVGGKVIDDTGEAVGKVGAYWMDPSTHRPAYLGIKSGWLSGKVHVVPVKGVQIEEEGASVRLPYSSAFVKKAPVFDPEFELAQVEKEEINAYFGRFISLQRVSSVEEMRPEEAIRAPGQEDKPQARSEGSEDKRQQTAKKEQAFFDQKGFVTESMPEVNASAELSRTQKEAKARNREDRIKNGSLD
jgi:hypothetical protein